MKFRKFAAIAALVLLSVSVVRSDDDAEQKKTKIRAAATETLNDLYKIQPSAKGAIQSAAGYAVFKNFGTNLLVVSTGSGAGVAVSVKSKQETFMKMISGGAGLGVRMKDFRAVFVFQTQKAFDDFLSSGWSGSAQTDAAAKAGTSGGALSPHRMALATAGAVGRLVLDSR